MYLNLVFYLVSTVKNPEGNPMDRDETYNYRYWHGVHPWTV